MLMMTTACGLVLYFFWVAVARCIDPPVPKRPDHPSIAAIGTAVNPVTELGFA